MQIILVHGIRRFSELAYAEELQRFAMNPGCHYDPIVTRELFRHQGRIPPTLRNLVNSFATWASRHWIPLRIGP
jgi:hypothetical protein